MNRDFFKRAVPPVILIYRPFSYIRFYVSPEFTKSVSLPIHLSQKGYMAPDFEKLIGECSFATARSSGSGGQKVNKVETKVLLSFDISNSEILSDAQKKVLAEKLRNRISKEGILQLTSETERSQLMNRKAVIRKFENLIERALQPVKKRKSTRPTAASVKKRLERKKQISEKKKNRGGRFEG